MQEIERTYLLSAMPQLPEGAERWQIEQGYLPDREHPRSEQNQPEGRLRRITLPNNDHRFEHTIKRGSGLVRTEEHRDISDAEFESLWPLTQGRRLVKTRYRIAVGEDDMRRVWEIDEFVSIPLVLAEVELPHATAIANIPDWLQPYIVREVTEEKQYRNYDLAIRLAR